MADLIQDPDKVAKLAEKREDENIEFREFLKWRLDWPDDRLDTLIHEVAGWVSEQIDCTACANCCRTQGVGVDDTDIERLSDRLGISPQDFESRYVSRNDLSQMVISQTPCPFLDGCLCCVYEDRPTDCREYPHLLAIPVARSDSKRLMLPNRLQHAGNDQTQAELENMINSLSAASRVWIMA